MAVMRVLRLDGVKRPQGKLSIHAFVLQFL